MLKEEKISKLYSLQLSMAYSSITARRNQLKRLDDGRYKLRTGYCKYLAKWSVAWKHNNEAIGSRSVDPDYRDTRAGRLYDVYNVRYVEYTEIEDRIDALRLQIQRSEIKPRRAVGEVTEVLDLIDEYCNLIMRDHGYRRRDTVQPRTRTRTRKRYRNTSRGR